MAGEQILAPPSLQSPTCVGDCAAGYYPLVAMGNKKMILFVIRDDSLRDMLKHALRDTPRPCHIVASIQDAQEVMQSQPVHCLVTTADVALAAEHSQDGLLPQLPPALPTVTLMQPGDPYPDYLYEPETFHDWCTIPFSLDELFARIDRTVSRAHKSIV